MSSSKTAVIHSSNTKVRKSVPGHTRQNSSSKSKRPSFSSNKSQIKQDRSFPCTFRNFGCDSTFANKNEWKRHVSSQHLQLGYYRCDLGTCDPDNLHDHNHGLHTNNTSIEIQVDENGEEQEFEVKTYNDFNRKDLFTQHCRRMHGPTRTNYSGNGSNTSKVTKDQEAVFEGELENIRKRCWRVRRKAPARTSCGFCHRVFETQEDSDDGSAELKAWEDRMEHLGRHYEKDGVRPEDEDVDDDLVTWGLETGIFVHVDMPPKDATGPIQIPWLKGFHVPGIGIGPGNNEAVRRGPRRHQSSRSAGIQNRQAEMIQKIRDQHQKKLLPLLSNEDEDADAEAEDE